MITGGIKKLEKRWTKCTDLNGGYVENKKEIDNRSLFFFSGRPLIQQPPLFLKKIIFVIPLNNKVENNLYYNINICNKILPFKIFKQSHKFLKLTQAILFIHLFFSDKQDSQELLR